MSVELVEFKQEHIKNEDPGEFAIAVQQKWNELLGINPRESKKIDEIVKFFEEAAAKANSKKENVRWPAISAQHILSLIYDQNTIEIVPKNLERAQFWREKACNNCYLPTMCQFIPNPFIVHANNHQIYQSLRMQACVQDPKTAGDALNQLGCINARCNESWAKDHLKGIQLSLKNAKEFLEEALELGQYYAYYNLYWLARKNPKIFKNEIKEILILLENARKVAIEKKDGIFFYLLSHCYANEHELLSRGLLNSFYAKKLDKLRKEYEVLLVLSEKFGHPKAAYRLYECSMFTKEGIRWFRRAQRNLFEIYGQNSLHWAIREKFQLIDNHDISYGNCILFLADLGVDLNMKEMYKKTKVISPNDNTKEYEQSHQGHTALTLSMSLNKIDFVRSLLEVNDYGTHKLHQRIDVNQKGREDKTPLHYAVEFETTLAWLIPSLLRQGANPNLTDSQGRTVYDLALSLNKTYALQLLKLGNFCLFKPTHLRAMANCMEICYLLNHPTDHLLKNFDRKKLEEELNSMNQYKHFNDPIETIKISGLKTVGILQIFKYAYAQLRIKYTKQIGEAEEIKDFDRIAMSVLSPQLIFFHLYQRQKLVFWKLFVDLFLFVDSSNRRVLPKLLNKHLSKLVIEYYHLDLCPPACFPEETSGIFCQESIHATHQTLIQARCDYFLKQYSRFRMADESPLRSAYNLALTDAPDASAALLQDNNSIHFAKKYQFCDD